MPRRAVFLWEKQQTNMESTSYLVSAVKIKYIYGMMAPRTRPSTLRTSCPFLFFVSMIDWLHGANGSRRPRDDAEEFPLFIGHSFLLENFLECFRSDLMSLIDNIIIKYDCRSRVCIYWWISFDSDASNREQRWTSSDGRRLVHVGTNAADAPALPAKLVCDLFRPLVRFDTVISLLSFFLFPPTLSLSRLHFTGDQKKKENICDNRLGKVSSYYTLSLCFLRFFHLGLML